MLLTYIIFITICGISISSATSMYNNQLIFKKNSTLNNYDIELVQVIFSHGERTPNKEELFPTLQSRPSDYEPYGYGHLTDLGKRNMFILGGQLKNMYGLNFLGETYKPKDVYAYSLNIDRTKMGLQLVLASLYPPNPHFSWFPGFNWQPFATSYNRIELDFMMTAANCPEYTQILKNLTLLSEIEKKYPQFHNTYSNVMKKAGLPADNYLRSIRVFRAIECRKNMGLPIPSWVSDKEYGNLKDLVGFLFDILAGTQELNKIAVGATMKRLVDNVNNQKKDDWKIHLYGGLDANVNYFLKAHGFWDPKIIPYGSAVIMEKLRGRDNRVYIRLLLWTGSERKLFCLKLKDCEEVCPLSKYLEIMKPAIPNGKGTECMSKRINQTLLDEIVNKDDITSNIYPENRPNTLIPDNSKGHH